jgi:hypothetical protein
MRIQARGRGEKYSNIPRLGEFLHDRADLANQLSHRHSVDILQVVLLSGLAGATDQHTKVGTHAGIGDTDIVAASESKMKKHDRIKRAIKAGAYEMTEIFSTDSSSTSTDGSFFSVAMTTPSTAEQQTQ